MRIFDQKIIDEHDKLCEKNKKNWPNGKWINEPNFKGFKAHGLDCLVVRNPRWGYFCGYVGVSPGHILYGVNYNDIEKKIGKVSVHYGLTYSNKYIAFFCQIPVNKEFSPVWWLGFDCNHCNDLSPAHVSSFPDWGGVYYRDFLYAMHECDSLARQLSEL